MKQNEKIIVKATLAALAMLGTSSLWASGFQLLEQNASGLGNSYAGSAVVAENASTVFFNPAGMTRLQKNSATLGVTPVVSSFKFTDGGSSSGALNGTGAGGDAGGAAFVPNAYYAYGINKDLYVGLGISVPFGLKTEYSSPWVGAAQALMFDIKTTNINPSVAYRVTDKLSLGAGLNYMHMEAQYKRIAAVASAATAATFVTLKADGHALGWNAGAIFDVSENMSLGLSYRSVTKQKLEGTLNVSGTLSGASAALTSGDAEARIALPETWIFSIKQKLDDKWTMLGDVSRTRWSRINDVYIVRTSGSLSGSTAQTLEAHFRDTWRVALGATQQLNSAWKMKYGVAYDQSPVKSAEERLVSLPDSDRIWFSLGTQWQVSKASTLDIGAAYLYIRDVHIDNNQTASGRGRVTGTYSGNVMIFGAQYAMSF